MPERGGYDPEAENRAAQWEADRATEVAPLPFAGDSHYPTPTARQFALGAAEEGNIAEAAGKLRLTSVEYNNLRKELGHSPSDREAAAYLSNKGPETGK